MESPTPSYSVLGRHRRKCLPLGRDSFQEVNTSQITKAITKANFLVTARRLLRRMAFRIASCFEDGIRRRRHYENAFTEECRHSYVPMEMQEDRRHPFQDQTTAQSLRNAKRLIITPAAARQRSANAARESTGEEYGIPVVNPLWAALRSGHRVLRSRRNAWR